ncbi:hypothetical protein [Pseudoalteromonas luteoviolacea]|uniref:hypothetical protein n=1 Tax=Pseudoalteromonas luteoviolacea TaxID=43657 RepID=UPI0011546B25|nr:hypothetical protein [Pseudoalteromonas luteoviolacea]TQF69870.1 hypothetical protein FLM44_01885 [Pseudoalteromonas luteoviolacea]
MLWSVWWLANATTYTSSTIVLPNEELSQVTQLPSKPSVTVADASLQAPFNAVQTKQPLFDHQQPSKPQPEETLYIPPIAEKSKKTIQPQYSGDFDDYEKYNDFLLEQETSLKRDYVAAVDKKVERLSHLLQKGINAGLPESQLNEAREKIAALRKMKQHLEKELNAPF